MFRLLKTHKDLFYLMISVIISQLGTWFTYMLMIVAVYNETKDVLTTMILTAAEMIAGLIGGQLAGVFVENRESKDILISRINHYAVRLTDRTSGIIIDCQSIINP
ncbi:MAG: hypothetical protein ABF629_09285 [Sporolactobacillus sp.]